MSDVVDNKQKQPRKRRPPPPLDTALAYTVPDAGKVSGHGRTRIYQLIGEGRLDARRSGGRTLIMADSLRAYLASLPAADIHTGQKAAA